MTWVNGQLDAQLRYVIRFYYYNPLHVSSKSAHHQEVKLY